jgi:hypothetical protein
VQQTGFTCFVNWEIVLELLEVLLALASLLLQPLTSRTLKCGPKQMRGTNVGTERKNKVYLKLNYMFEMNTVMKD